MKKIIALFGMIALFFSTTAFAQSYTAEETAQLALQAGMNEIGNRMVTDQLTAADMDIINTINTQIPFILNKIQNASNEVDAELDPVVLDLTPKILTQQTQYTQVDIPTAAKQLKKMLISSAVAEDTELRLQGKTPLLTDTASQVLQEEMMQELNNLFQDMMDQTESYMNATPTPEEQNQLKQQLLEMFPGDMLQELYQEYGNDILDRFVKMSPQEQMEFIMEIFQKEAEKQQNKDQSYHRQTELDTIYKSLQTLQA